MENENQGRDFDVWKRNISPGRFKVYSNAAKGNENFASELYLWNSKTSAAFWELIGHLEIALRAVIDRQLIQAFPDDDWILSFKVFNESDPIRQVIRKAIYRAAGNSHNQVIEQLPLGFVQVIVSKRYLRLWPHIAAGFTGGERHSFGEISALIKMFRLFRNRVGHHDLLVDEDLETIHRNLLRLAELVEPGFKSWLQTNTDVDSWIRQKPSV